jgi:TRAP-type C4-dicarboxylate transport system substrate-binding protein
LLWPFVLDPYNLVAKKKEITSAEGFKGLKVGGSGPKMEIVKANGGAHVAQAPPETYLNMDKGVIDAAFISFAQVNDYRIYEIADFYSTQAFGSGYGLILMNTGFYNSLPAEDQKILAETLRDATDVSAETVMEDNNRAKRKL